MNKQQQLYKTYCFHNNIGDILFFSYNSNHPFLLKSVKFELGKVRIFTVDGIIYNSNILSTPHLNAAMEWNQQFFQKLFHGLNKFQVDRANPDDPDDNSYELLVKDLFVEEGDDDVFLLRVKLADNMMSYSQADYLWNTFNLYNQEKTSVLQSIFKDNQTFRENCDGELSKLVQLQQTKELEKLKLKGQLSALLRQKQAKLLEFQKERFEYGQEKDFDPASIDLTEQKDSLSMAGSLFPDSQQFVFHSD